MKQLAEKHIQELKISIPIYVGKRIREEREKQQRTQTHLAEAVGKDRQYLYKIEAGKVTPNIATVAILADALEMTVWELLTPKK